MFTAASTQALHGHNARVVPSLNLEHLVCLCPKIHGFLRLAIEAVLIATFSVIGMPEEMPPRMPPWLLVFVIT